jgi:hypothetical protein
VLLYQRESVVTSGFAISLRVHLSSTRTDASQAASYLPHQQRARPIQLSNPPFSRICFCSTPRNHNSRPSKVKTRTCYVSPHFLSHCQQVFGSRGVVFSVRQESCRDTQSHLQKPTILYDPYVTPSGITASGSDRVAAETLPNYRLHCSLVSLQYEKSRTAFRLPNG